MINEVIKRSIIGVAFGGIFTFIALTIMKFAHVQSTVDEIWLHMFASLITGIYFGLSSFILDSNIGSPLKRTVIHFCLSLVVYLCIALPVGWVPFITFFVFMGILIFTIVYILFWTAAYLYYRKQAISMNEHLQHDD